MELEFYKDLQSAFLPAESGGQATATIQKRGNWDGSIAETKVEARKGGNHTKKVAPYAVAMRQSYPDAEIRLSLMDGLETWAREKIGTGDVTSLLVTSISERDAYIRNAETPLLNLMESVPGGPMVVKDWSYRIPERRFRQKAARVNPEQSPLTTAENYTLRSEKYNQLAFWGDPVSVSIVSEAMVKNQTGIDLMKQDMDAEMLAIRKAKNYDYWNGQIQRSFAPYNVPQVGGLISRIFTNISSALGANINDAELSVMFDSVSTPVGFNLQKVIFTDPNQVRAVRAFEIARYPGNNAMAFWEYNKILSAAVKKYNLMFDRMYDPGIGPPAPVIHDTDMPSGTVVVLTITPDYMPREARFQIGGEFGPHVFVRQQYDLKDTVFMIDGGTVDDPAEEAKALANNSL